MAYNALLLQITTPATVGRVSGIGWGSGYVGGIVLLIVLFVGFINPDVGWFGVTSADGWNIRAAVAVSAVWMAVFAVPVLVGVPEHARPDPRAIGAIGAYRSLGHDVAHLWRTRRSTLGYLVASAVYRDGLAGVFTFGAVLASGTFGFTSSQVIVFAIAANVVAGISTIAAGWLDDRFGPRRVITVSLVVLVLAAVAVFVLHDQGQTAFWVAGLVLSSCVGPTQSASRGLLARLTDPGREAEAFGLYATTGRAASLPGADGVLPGHRVGRRAVLGDPRHRGGAGARPRAAAAGAVPARARRGRPARRGGGRRADGRRAGVT